MVQVLDHKAFLEDSYPEVQSTGAADQVFTPVVVEWNEIKLVQPHKWL